MMEPVKSEVKINKIIEIEEGQVVKVKENDALSVLNEVISIKKKLGKDLNYIILLFYLYFLQAIPLGLALSIPYFLSSRKVTFTDQAIFNFSFWIFSLKIFWAPVVDSIFIKRFGRRKSWLIPLEFLIGLFMLLLANRIELIFSDEIILKEDLLWLLIIFISLNLLTSTQEIVLDGWALSMLHKDNVSWQSTCSYVGQSSGTFLACYLLILLESKDFSNKFIRPLLKLDPKDQGIITIKMFMCSFGLIYLFTMVLLMIFKKENILEEETIENKLTSFIVYKQIWHLICLKPIQTISIILLTVKFSFVIKSVNTLKLIDVGVSKESTTLLSIVLMPITIICPLLLSKYINRSTNQLVLFIKLMPFRLFLYLLTALFVFYAPYFKNPNNQQEFSLSFYFIYFAVFSLTFVVESSMSASMFSFFSRICDQTIGATYMSFLASLNNLGGNMSGSLMMFLISALSCKFCQVESAPQNKHFERNISNKLPNKCSTSSLVNTSIRGTCVSQFDAYYLMVCIYVIFGVFWILFYWKRIIRLSHLPVDYWRIFK